MVTVGGIYACIAGDHRYSDSLTVVLDGDAIRVEVNATAAVGGMDSFDGATAAAAAYRKILPANAKPAVVLAAIKTVLANDSFAFKRYGKPTKNFRWFGGARGLNVSLCSKALLAAVAS